MVCAAIGRISLVVREGIHEEEEFILMVSGRSSVGERQRGTPLVTQQWPLQDVHLEPVNLLPYMQIDLANRLK